MTSNDGLISFTVLTFFCRNLAYQYRRMMSVPNTRRGSTPVHAVFTRRQVSYTSTTSNDVITNELFASSKDYAGRALPASLHDIFKVRNDSCLRWKRTNTVLCHLMQIDEFMHIHIEKGVTLNINLIVIFRNRRVSFMSKFLFCKPG